MRTLSATECIIIIGYDDEEGDAHFYTVTATMREIREKAGSTEEFIKSIISETKIKNVFLKRWIYENGVIDY
jgi:hypothetical protein